MTSTVRVRLDHAAARRTVLELVSDSTEPLTLEQLRARLAAHRHAADRAVQALAGEGRLLLNEVVTTDRLGRPRVGLQLAPRVAGTRITRQIALPRFSGPALRRARLRARVSLAALGRALGVGESAVRWWERQEVVPPARAAEILQALAHLRAQAQAPVSPRTAARLRSLRLGAGWSQARLAAALRVSQSTISNWESGEHLSHENARRIYRLLAPTGA
ncbi:MAG TPA: helix-turn-helix transcriptional regulator [Solirubrobacteraceae bacterium]